MTNMPHNVELSGLDAHDPLAYLAALGCLLGATSHCQRAGLPIPRLSFRVVGVPVPTLHGPFERIEALASALMDDLDECAGRCAGGSRDRFLAFSYDQEGKPVRDLKPPPDVFRRFALSLIDEANSRERRAVDWAAATLTDVAVDGGGAAKPFALHFTAGNQRFLNIALELLDGAGEKRRPSSPSRPVDTEDLRLALAGPWPNDRTLKVFSWSPTQDRPYALRAVDPADDPKLGTPGADWLALRGIGMLSSCPVGSEIHTSGIQGRWKSATFSYPIWPKPLDADAVRSLLRHPGVCADGEGKVSERLTLPLGVEVLVSRISRPERYGAFSQSFRRRVRLGPC